MTTPVITGHAPGSLAVESNGGILLSMLALPAPQSRAVVERAVALEGKPAGSGAAKSSDNLAGVWSWAGKKLEFGERAIVTVNKKNGGKWVWATSDQKSFIAFVLEPGDTVAMARISNSKGVLEIMPIKGQPSEARRE